MNLECNEMVKIQGLILPTEWDEKGDVLVIALSAFNEDEYLIDIDEIGKQLLSSLRVKVEAKGFVREEKGKKKIKIRNYTILNQYE
jgi:hypothetical protein